MNRSRVWTVAALGFALAACGSDDPTEPFAQATSQLCTNVSGLEAVFYDLINGVPRGDLPPTAFTIPFNIDFSQSPYSNSTSLLLGFMVPQGWTVSDAVDVSGFAIPGTVAGADLARADGRAIWRYMLNAQIAGGFTSASIVESEVAAAVNFVGNPSGTTVVCEINAQATGILGPESIAARLVRVGDYTIFSRVHVIIIPGTSAFYSGFTSVAPTAESNALINDIFVPMITQLYGGGSSDPAQCSDGIDNDGDTAIDYPSDAQCSSPADDNESS